MTAGAHDLAAALHRHLAAPPPGACAWFVDEAGTTLVDWAELGVRASGFAAACEGLGAVPGDVVAIAWRHGPLAAAAWAGAVLGGFVPTFVPGEDARIAERLGTAVRVTTGPGALASWPSAALRSPTAAPGVAIVQRTSGTTGTHRAVAIDHRRVLAQVAGLAAALQLSPADRIASCLPLHHDMGLVSAVLLPLCCGIPCVHVDPALWRSDAAALLRATTEHAATLTWLPPSALSRMVRRVNDRGLELSSLRQIVTGGEVVPDAALVEFAARFASVGLAPGVLGCGWGMAENVAAVTHTPPGRAPTRLRVAWSAFAPGQRVIETTDRDALVLISTGAPIAGTEVVARDGDGRDVGERVIGELFVRGTCRDDVALWHATGDVGLVVDGEVYVCGRAAELLHVDGRWIPPHEAERAAAEIRGVRPGRVAAITDAAGGFTLLVEGANALDRDAIADAVQARTLRRPRVVIVAANSLPRSTSGKLGRSRCAALLDAT